MKLLFVRHSIALEREEWDKDDLLRPLSKEGLEVAEDFFKEIAKIYGKTKFILSSKATRAIETAQILNDSIKESVLEFDPLLNPGCSFEEFRSAIEKHRDKESLFVVGHEPDFSEIISCICSDSLVAMKLKKPSLVEVKLHNGYKGEMLSLLKPKIFKTQK